MTKRQSALYSSYLNATARNLCEVYGSYSSRKAAAETHCRECAYMLNGYDCRIPSHNSQAFTFAFRYPDPETGHERLQYHTFRNVYDFEIA